MDCSGIQVYLLQRILLGLLSGSLRIYGKLLCLTLALATSDAYFLVSLICQITLIVLLNIALYLFFTGMLFLIARVIPVPSFLRDKALSHPPDILLEDESAAESSGGGWWEERKLMDAETTIALLFCGAAKGLSDVKPCSLI